MTTSAYMPDVQVHIAFDSGYSTPAASRTWTDVSAYVELAQGINITRGRGDEFATTDPNKLSLTLDNRDGRFTAGKTGGAYYPNVKIGRPIKVTSTPVGGTPSVRFLGYVDEWPVEWNGSDAYAFAKISASSRMARLGFDAELHSTVDEERILGTSPALYLLDEPAGSTRAFETAIGGTYLAADAATFGATLPLPVERPGATLANSGYIGGLLPVPLALTSGVLIECFASFSSFASVPKPIELRTIDGQVLYLAVVNSTLIETYFDNPLDATFVSNVQTCPSITLNTAHHFAVRALDDGAGSVTVEAYVDGVSIGSTTTAGVTSAPVMLSRVRIGQQMNGTGSTVLVNGDLATLASRASAGVTGYAGETAAQRIIRIGAYAGIPAGEIAADAGTNPVNVVDTTGVAALDAMRTVEETEGGVLFDGRDNTLTFHGRARRYNAATAFTLDAALQELEAGMAPKLDRSALVNDVTGTASDGTTARAINQASIDDYGYARESIEIASSYDAAYQAAAWRVGIYGEPQARIPSLGVDLLPLSQVRQDSLFAIDVSSRVALGNLPAQAPATSLSFFVEGYTETISNVAYDFDFNISPTTGYDVFTLDDATKGVLDNTTYKLAY